MKNKTRGIILGALLLAGKPVFAVELVFDAQAVGAALSQVEAWGEQFTQMKDQLEQMKSIYLSNTGIRGMEKVANDPEQRKYLPAIFNDMLKSGYANQSQIRALSSILELDTTNIDPQSDIGKVFQGNASQASFNRATFEQSYNQTSRRFDDIQELMDTIKRSPDPKDIADLQARIEIEKAELQNENNRLIALAQLAEAQEDLLAQQGMEVRMKSSVVTSMPEGW